MQSIAVYLRSVFILTIAVWSLNASAQRQDRRVGDVATRVTPFLREGGNPFELSKETFDSLSALPSYTSPNGNRDYELRIGRIFFQPVARYSILHDDNIQGIQGIQVAEESDVIHDISAAVQGNLMSNGNSRFGLSYAGGYQLFQDNRDLSAARHRGDVDYGILLGEWDIGLGADFSITEEPSLLGTARSKRSAWGVQLDSSYPLSGRVDLIARMARDSRSFRGGFDTQTYSGSLGIGYDLAARTDLALVLGGGIQNAESTVDSNFQTIELEADYELTGRFNLAASVGAQLRQFKDSGENMVNPIFGADAQWRPRDTTSVSLRLQRTAGSSNFVQNNADITTTAALQLSQSILDEILVSLSGGVGMIDSRSTVSGLQSARDRGFYFVTLNVGYSPTERTLIGVFYSYRNREEGSGNVVGAVSNRVGISFSYVY